MKRKRSSVARVASDSCSKGLARIGRTLACERGGEAAPRASRISTLPHDIDLCAQTPERGTWPGGSLHFLKAAIKSRLVLVRPPPSWAPGHFIHQEYGIPTPIPGGRGGN